MKTIRAYGLAVATLGVLLTAPSRHAIGQQFEEAPPERAATTDDSWYQAPAPRVEKQSVSREKAMARGQQRMARLEAMRWYGFYGSRPTAASMPYTSMYSPAWQQPGGRPFAWYTSSRPITIYHVAPTYR
jgi:hypothetical protein